VPSTLTHWRIAIEALHRLPQAGQTLPAPTTLKTPPVGAGAPGRQVPVLVYVGAIGPDLPYNAGITTRSTFFPTKRERAERGKSAWADRMHYNRSGALLIELVRFSRQVSAPELRRKILYYALGHATHIAGDMIMHPYTNTFAGAYHDQSNPAMNTNLGIHFQVEFCHDLATDIQFFHARSNTLRRRPWLRYLAGARAELTQSHQGYSLLDALKAAARAVYQLDDAQTTEFGQRYLSGLQGAQALMRVLRYYPLVNPFLHLSPRLSTYFTQQTIPGASRALTFDQTLAFATQVGSRLCARIAA
jgi:hypothetical protein